MKSIIARRITNAPFVLLLILLFSCGQKTGEFPADAETDTKYAFASENYAALVEEYFQYFKAFNFEAMGEMLSDDVMYFSPMGDHELRNVRKGKSIIIPWLTEWSTTSGVDSLAYSNLSLIPLHVKDTNPLYNLKGTVVIAFYTGESWYGNRHTKNGFSHLFHFDGEGKIDKIYQFNDMHQILEAVTY